MTLDADGNLETPREDRGEPDDTEYRRVPEFTVQVDTPLRAGRLLGLRETDLFMDAVRRSGENLRRTLQAGSGSLLFGSRRNQAMQEDIERRMIASLSGTSASADSNPWGPEDVTYQRLYGGLGDPYELARGALTSEELERLSPTPKPVRTYQQGRTVDGIRYEITEYDNGSRTKQIIGGSSPVIVPRAKWRAR